MEILCALLNSKSHKTASKINEICHKQRSQSDHTPFYPSIPFFPLVSEDHSTLGPRDVYVNIVVRQEHFYQLLEEHFRQALELSHLPNHTRIYSRQHGHSDKGIKALHGWITTFGQRVTTREDIDPSRLYTIITNGELP